MVTISATDGHYIPVHIMTCQNTFTIPILSLSPGRTWDTVKLVVPCCNGMQRLLEILSHPRLFGINLKMRGYKLWITWQKHREEIQINLVRLRGDEMCLKFHWCLRLVDEGRANYWIYLHNFPCHHKFSDHAETAALRVLQLMAARKCISTRLYTCCLTYRPENLTNADRTPHTPFSMEDIQRYIDFFEFSDKLKDKPVGVTDVSVAKNIIIANIMANFCALSILFLVRWALTPCRPLPVKKPRSRLRAISR